MNFLEEDEFLEDNLDFLEMIEFGFPRKIYTRRNPFEMDDLGFFRRFRLYKQTVLEVLQRIEERLEYPTDANNSLSPINQLLLTLRFYASSGYLINVADYMECDVSTASRTVLRVSESLASLRPIKVKMPVLQNLVREQNKFYNIARYPRVITVVDGTHIKMKSPGGDNPEVYRNRKGYFSYNVQVGCDADQKFTDIVARWPGSTHDSTIFSNSNLRMRFEANEFGNSLLMGDSGYPLRSYFMTPLRNPTTRGQNLHNEALIRTRNIVERTIGLWKRRFPVLAYGMRLKPETIKTITVACAVLHNIAIEQNEPMPPVPEDINEEELNYLIEAGNINDPVDDEPVVAGLNMQRNIVNFFENL